MNIVDIQFHLHPDLSVEQRDQLEETISTYNGVMHAQFDNFEGYDLSVSYDPDALKAETILTQLRDWDQNVRMIGL